VYDIDENLYTIEVQEIKSIGVDVKRVNWLRVVGSLSAAEAT
jgi:hypothetical protein